MKTNSSTGFLFCWRRSHIMVFEGVFKFSACSSAGGRTEELPNQQAQDQVQAKPAAFAASIILRIRILANGFTSSLNIFDAFQNSPKTRPNVISCNSHGPMWGPLCPRY